MSKLLALGAKVKQVGNLGDDGGKHKELGELIVSAWLSTLLAVLVKA